MIRIELAGICIEVQNRYDYMERISKDYMTDKEPQFSVFSTEEEIDREAEASGVGLPRGYLESVVLYRHIADKLPMYDAFVFHGAVLKYKDNAYAFTARSGVGKTTHTRLWLTEFSGEACYLNGDKPIIRIIDGVPYAFGTPYKGKEGYGTNDFAVLSAIAFLERAEQNSARIVSPDFVSTKLISQIYMPKDRQMAIKTMILADKVLSSVRLAELKCNMNSDAAHVARAVLCE